MRGSDRLSRTASRVILDQSAALISPSAKVKLAADRPREAHALARLSIPLKLKWCLYVLYYPNDTSAWRTVCVSTWGKKRLHVENIKLNSFRSCSHTAREGSDFSALVQNLVFRFRFRTFLWSSSPLYRAAYSCQRLDLAKLTLLVCRITSCAAVFPTFPERTVCVVK